MKQQEAPPEITNTKEDIGLEQMEVKVKISALECDGFVLQEQSKSLMYVDHSIRGDPKKDKLIDELNFKNFVCLKRKTIRKFFVGITCKKEGLVFIMNFFDANNIFSHLFIQNLKHKPSMVQ